MATPLGPENPLARPLATLESIGFGRPANVLFSEYLAAFVAEGVLDDPTSKRIGGAYHRSQYGILDAEDAEIRAAIAALDAVIENVAKLEEQPRREWAARVRERFESATAARVPGSAEPPGTKPLVFWDDFARKGAALVEPPFEEGSTSSIPDGEQPRRRRWRVPPVSARLAIWTAAAVLFGYVLRASGVLTTDSDERGWVGFGAKGLTPATVWTNDKAWVSNLRARAQFESSGKHDQSARSAYELLILYSSQESVVLNELAWLYLTSGDPAVRDSKRGLEVAQRALSLNPRSALILDTTAEGHFQAGDFEQAVALEREALRRLPVSFFPGNDETRRFVEKQLAKFEQAKESGSREPQPSEPAPDSAASTDSPPETGRSKVN